MIKKKIILHLFFVFVLLVSFVNAQEAFDIVSDTEVDLCPCSNQAYNILLQNTGPSVSKYQISYSGDAADWVNIAPSELILNPQTATNLMVNVNSPCDTNGEFGLDTLIKSTQTGLTKKISQNLNFLACYDYSISLGEAQDFEEEIKSVSFIENENGYEICEETTKKVIPILIENKENYGNVYDINFVGEDWSNLNAAQFELEGKQKGILLLTLEPPKGSEGTYKLGLNTITRLGQLEKSTDIDVKVDKCYDLSLDIKKENDQLCGGEEKDYDIEIKNNGKFTETLNLNVEGSNFASFGNTTSLELDSDEQKTIKLQVNPDATDSGNYNIKVTATNGKVKIEDTINLDITKRNICYKSDIEFKTTIKNQYKHEVFLISIINNGIRKADYKISLEGPSWASITPSELELNPKQKGYVNLELNPGENISEGMHNILIKAESNNEVYSKIVDVNLKKENPTLKKIKATTIFYRYYIYLFIVLIIVTRIFWKPIKKPIKRQIKKLKEKREKKKALKEAKKEREEEKRKKIEERKGTEKIIEKEKRKKFFLWSKIYSTIIKFFKNFSVRSTILILIGTIVLFFVYRKNLFSYVKNFTILYLYYFVVGIIVLIVLILIVRFYKPIMDFLLEEDRKK